MKAINNQDTPNTASTCHVRLCCAPPPPLFERTPPSFPPIANHQPNDMIKITIMSNLFGSLKRLALIYSIVLLIALAHVFRLGSYLQGEWYNLYYSYFSDIVIPFGFYFLVCSNETFIPFLRHWPVKLAITFLTPAIAETCQYFGIALLGVTFDPLDYAMYAVGAGSAVLVDTLVFSRLFRFWPIKKAAGHPAYRKD